LPDGSPVGDRSRTRTPAQGRQPAAAALPSESTNSEAIRLEFFAGFFAIAGPIWAESMAKEKRSGPGKTRTRIDADRRCQEVKKSTLGHSREFTMIPDAAPPVSDKATAGGNCPQTLLDVSKICRTPFVPLALPS